MEYSDYRFIYSEYNQYVYFFFPLLIACYISELDLNTNTIKSVIVYGMKQFNNIKNLVICDSLKKGMEFK